MRGFLGFFICVLMAGASLPALASGDDKLRVAVTGFEGGTGHTSEVSVLLASELRKRGLNIEVLSEDRIEEAHLRIHGKLTGSSALEGAAGQSLGAELRLIDAVTGGEVKKLTGSAEGGANDLAHSLAARLAAAVEAALDTTTVTALTSRRFEARIVKTDGPSRVLVNKGSADGVRVGARATVRRHASTGPRALTVGAIEFTRVEERWAEARTVSGGEFHRDDYVLR